MKGCLMLMGFFIFGGLLLFVMNYDPPIGVSIFGAVFMAGGLSIRKSTSRNLKRGKASFEWPSVIGKVKISELYDETDPEVSRNKRAKVGIIYSYKVDNNDYEGNGAAFDMKDVIMGLERAQKIQRSYPVGSQVRVFYDPANPAISTLEHGTEWSQYGKSLSLAFTLIGFGIICLGLYWKLH